MFQYSLGAVQKWRHFSRGEGGQPKSDEKWSGGGGSQPKIDDIK